MDETVDDVRVARVRPLIPPCVLVEELPASATADATVRSARARVARIVRHQDDRLIVVVGPCSVHDPTAAVEYGKKLREVADRLKDDLCVLMRVYFEKPRTTVGWKGLINDPFLDQSFRINDGLHIARDLLCQLNEMGMPAAVEFLDTISPQYVADLVSWGAIGARTTESQVHRTDGGVQIAVDAIRAASQPHQFLSVTKQGTAAIVCTCGNDTCHLVLRGGKSGPNYDPESMGEAARIMRQAKITPSIMVDCSHDNSRKVYTNQPLVARAVAAQITGGNADIVGVMIESNLVQGRQDMPPQGPKHLTYGQSITDACVDFGTTVLMLEELATAVRRRREAHGISACTTAKRSQ